MPTTEEYLKMLESPNPSDREKAYFALEFTFKDQMAARCIELLSHTDYEIKASAADILKKLGKSDAIPPDIAKDIAEWQERKRKEEEIKNFKFVRTADGKTPDRIPFDKTDYTMEDLLRKLVSIRGSDLHMRTNKPPYMRVDGTLVPLDVPPIPPLRMKELLFSIISDWQIRLYAKKHDLDFAYFIKGLARFRGNYFVERNRMAAVFRIIPAEIISFEDLKLPPIIRALCDRPNGLVLVTGPTGSGKSTTLAAMLDYINRNKKYHIITIEEPVEFVHTPVQSSFLQREVGRDTHSFYAALRSALRQDPDVILVGEMRDLETISTALTTAETGKLVFGTLHTTSAYQTVERIVNVFPSEAQGHVRDTLASIIQGIISQTLIPLASGMGRTCAFEILVGTPAIRNLIREQKSQMIYSAMEAGSEFGMVTLETSLARMALEGIITLEDARMKTPNLAVFEDVYAKMKEKMEKGGAKK